MERSKDFPWSMIPGPASLYPTQTPHVAAFVLHLAQLCETAAVPGVTKEGNWGKTWWSKPLQALEAGLF